MNLQEALAILDEEISFYESIVKRPANDLKRLRNWLADEIPEKYDLTTPLAVTACQNFGS
jgi:hypothetical protein